jgi:putative endonuclease
MYFVYILLCSDGKHYSGLTKNIKVRLQNHSQGLSFSTKYRLPINYYGLESLEVVI